MTFNSLTYAAFLPIVLALYWPLRNHVRAQNVIIVIASYIFYGYWDYRFLSLLIVSTVVDYVVGRRLHQETDDARRKALFAVSLIVNLGILGFFKYFNFFVDSAQRALDTLGLESNPAFLSVVLPVGISFYTFQTLSYTFDIYREQLEPTRDLVSFAAFVAFFPQLVAGPIERARRLLPQIESARRFRRDQLATGLGLILLGLFKKVAIADVMGGVANDVFNNASSAGALTLLVGIYAFALQIYGDFSGYTDIARGSARLLGIELMENFRQPYLSTNITEFWRRWHISLSTWLRDYLYIPLGGNRYGRFKVYRNLMLTMLLGGLWHGAAWTFVVWGGLHGLYLSIHRRFRDRPRTSEGALPRVVAGLATFHLVCLSWVFFRAESFEQAWSYLGGLAGRQGEIIESHIALVLPAMIAVLSIDTLQRLSKSDTFFLTWRPAARGFAYATLVTPIVIFSGGQPTPFVYFQF